MPRRNQRMNKHHRTYQLPLFPSLRLPFKFRTPAKKVPPRQQNPETTGEDLFHNLFWSIERDPKNARIKARDGDGVFNIFDLEKSDLDSVIFHQPTTLSFERNKISFEIELEEKATLRDILSGLHSEYMEKSQGHQGGIIVFQCLERVRPGKWKVVFEAEPPFEGSIFHLSYSKMDGRNCQGSLDYLRSAAQVPETWSFVTCVDSGFDVETPYCTWDLIMFCDKKVTESDKEEWFRTIGKALPPCTGRIHFDEHHHNFVQSRGEETWEQLASLINYRAWSKDLRKWTIYEGSKTLPPGKTVDLWKRTVNQVNKHISNRYEDGQSIDPGLRGINSLNLNVEYNLLNDIETAKTSKGNQKVFVRPTRLRIEIEDQLIDTLLRVGDLRDILESLRAFYTTVYDDLDHINCSNVGPIQNRLKGGIVFKGLLVAINKNHWQACLGPKQGYAWQS